MGRLRSNQRAQAWAISAARSVAGKVAQSDINCQLRKDRRSQRSPGSSVFRFVCAGAFQTFLRASLCFLRSWASVQSAACDCADFQVLGKSAERDWSSRGGGEANVSEREFFRTNAKADGNEFWIAGWALDSDNTKQCRWFAEKLDHINVPWVYLAGEAYRQIASLKLLATLGADYSRFDSRFRSRFDLRAFKGIVVQDFLRLARWYGSV